MNILAVIYRYQELKQLPGDVLQKVVPRVGKYSFLFSIQ